MTLTSASTLQMLTDVVLEPSVFLSLENSQAGSATELPPWTEVHQPVTQNDSQRAPSPTIQ